MLQQLMERHSIVIVGAWNPHIFLPDWVGKHLAHETVNEVGVAINNRALPLRYSIGKAYLLVGPQKLQVNPKDLSLSTLTQASQIAEQVLQLLSHTPVSGIGVNFGYGSDTNGEVDRSVFDGPDVPLLSALDAVILSTEVRRAITVEGISVRYALSAPTSGSSTLGINFHRETTSASEAAEHLAIGMPKFLDVASRIANAVYRTEDE